MIVFDPGMTESAIIEASPPAEVASPHRLLKRVCRLFDAVFGFISLVFFLAVVSAIPLLNLLSLGYLLESSARIARSGRIRDGLIGLSRFARAGTIALGVWLWILPIRLTLSFLRDAWLVDPESQAVTNLQIFLVLLVIAIGIHLVWALIRGGKARHFIWPAPVRFLRWLGEARDWRGAWHKITEFFAGMRLLSVWKTGALGFLGAAVWLALPVGILMLAADSSNQGLSALGSLLGGILLAVAVFHVPFLQTRFAMSGKFGEFFDRRTVGRLFRRAPIAMWIALFTTLLFAIPLYLLKIELTPQEVAWLTNIVFVIFILPARLLVGWAVSRADRAGSDRIWITRWAARLLVVPVVAGYAFIVWLAQYLSWHGSLGLMEQHAFLVPAPLLGL